MTQARDYILIACNGVLGCSHLHVMSNDINKRRVAKLAALKAQGLVLLILPADDLPQDLKAVIQQDQLPVVHHTLHIGYDQMSADEIIRV